jgi:hypothetical protein
MPESTRALQLAKCLVVGCLAVSALDAATFRVYKCGSSSFPDEILETARDIIEAGSEHTIAIDRAGYTRLDNFVDGVADYQEWLTAYMPRIQSGNYDFVIFQTINWYYNSPLLHDSLFQGILPDLTARVRNTGAQVILYDKYVGYKEGCYRDPPYSNLLWHLEAAARSDIGLITFDGPAETEVRVNQVLSGNYAELLHHGAHPGPVLNYMTACDLAWLIAGVDPRGSNIRHVYMTKDQMDNYGSYPEVNAAESTLVLTLAIADTLQRIAMRQHLAWTERLNDNLESDSLFFNVTMPEIEQFESEYGNVALIGHTLTPNDSTRCDLANKPSLTAQELAEIRATLGALSPRVQARAQSWLPGAAFDTLVASYREFWLQYNSKLRDDVYYENLIALALAEHAGDIPERDRLQRASGVLLEILSLAAETMAMTQLAGAQQQQALATFAWPDSFTAYAPAFAAAQTGSLDSLSRLDKAREIYFGVWEDVNLMDELKADNFSQAVWLKADSIFSVRWQDYLGGSVARQPRVPSPGRSADLSMVATPQGITFCPADGENSFEVTIVAPHGQVLARLQGSTKQFFAWPAVAAHGIYLVKYSSGTLRRQVPYLAAR